MLAAGADPAKGLAGAALKFAGMLLLAPGRPQGEAWVEPSAGGGPGGECVFRLVGNRWKVILFGGRPFWLPKTLGPRYLNYLLHEPNDPIASFALEVKVQPEKAKARAPDSIQAQSDAQARRQYRGELQRLRAEAAAAETAGQPEQAARLREEFPGLERALRGKDIGADAGERARNNVRKAIDVVMKYLWQAGPEERAFARHLDEHLSIGHQCLYSQELGRIWQ